MKLRTAIVLLLLPLFSFAQEAEPVGWASLNGGTTGGAGGDTVTVTNRSQFTFYVSSTQPYVILVQDTISLQLYERVRVTGNKTILGLGHNATLLYGGLEIKGDNVIIRNIRITGSYDGDWDGKTHSTDAITIYSKNVWIDHCDLSASADGLLDIRADGANAADYVTISWTRLSNHNKVMLFGAGDDEIANRGHLRVTLHHCWFDGYPGRGLNQRMPRIRFGDVHVYNTFYDEIDSYCIAARFESDVVVENNFFRNSRYPHNIEDQGLGLENPDLVATGNIYEFTSGAKLTGGVAFNPSDFYPYSLDDPNLLPGMVMNGAGLFNDPNNQYPTAQNDHVTLELGTSQTLTINPLNNDIDPDGDDLRIAAILNTPSGVARLLHNEIRYTTPLDQNEPDTIVYQLVDTQGGTDTALVIISFGMTTDVNDHTIAENALRISPNPLKDNALIEYVPLGFGAVRVQVFDVTGQSVNASIQSLNANSQKGLLQFSLEVSHLPVGIYFVKIQEGNQLITSRILVIK